MSNIDVSAIRAAIANRVATEWTDTAVVDMATSGTYFQPGSMSVAQTVNTYIPNAIGFSSQQTEVRKTTRDTSVSFSHDMIYSGAGLWKAVAAFLGTIDPATVVSGEVVQHVLDFAGTPSGSSSLAYTIETDKVISVPNIAWSTLGITFDNADVPVVSLDGIGDAIIVPDDATTTGGDLETLYTNRVTFDPAIWATCSSYFRIGDYSTSVALSGANDLQVTNVTLNMTRPLETRFVQRGCNSANTLKPRVAGLNEGTLTFTLGKQLTSDYDLLNVWNDGTYQMAELMIQSDTAISGSYYPYIKFQFPYLAIVDFPESLDASNGRDGLVEPVVTCVILKPPAVAAGMTGVTEYCRVTVQNAEPTSYLAE